MYRIIFNRDSLFLEKDTNFRNFLFSQTQNFEDLITDLDKLSKNERITFLAVYKQKNRTYRVYYNKNSYKNGIDEVYNFA